jgi:hypothetical protein
MEGRYPLTASRRPLKPARFRPHPSALIPVLLLSTLAWTPPQRIDRKPTGYLCSRPNLAFDQLGIAHAVWTETPEEGRYYNKVMYCRRAGDTWTVPVNISRDSGDLRWPAILIMAERNPMVVWSEEGSARVRYVRQLSDTWSVPKLCFAAHGITPALALDSTGRVHLLFEEFTGRGGIWHSRYLAQPDSWTTPVRVDSSDLPLGFSDISAAPDGRLHAVWMSWGTHAVHYARFEADTWTRPIRLPDLDSVHFSVMPRIAVDPGCAPHVVWEERTSDHWICHSMPTGDSWTSPLVLDSTGFHPDVHSDSEGRVHVVWHWESSMLYRYRTDSVWSEPQMIVENAVAPLQTVTGTGSLVGLIWRRPDWCILYTENGPAAIAETPERKRGAPLPGPTIVRDVLRLGQSGDRPSSGGTVPVLLLDPAGRIVMHLLPGDNDVRHLSPGIYFIRRNAVGGRRQAVTKVILSR